MSESEEPFVLAQSPLWMGNALDGASQLFFYIWTCKAKKWIKLLGALKRWVASTKQEMEILS